MDVHLVRDNLATHKTPAINDCLARHRRFHVHFTASWFGLRTEQVLRRGVHKSVAALEYDVSDWIAAWNEDPKPFR